jgi:hypothetical protein
MSDPTKVRPVPALLTPITAFYREFADIFRNPTALIGGVLGSGAFMAGAAAIAIFGLGPLPKASAAEDDELDMEFVPGELVRLGEKMDPMDIPEKIIVEETVAAAAADRDEDHRRREGRPEPRAREDRQAQGPQVKATEAPDPNKKGAKESDKNREGNKQYDKDMPTVKDLPGDPFGSPNGWSDMAKDGDPWATAVLGALNGMKVGAYAGAGHGGDLQVPAGGLRRRSVDRIKVTQPSGDAQLDGAIKNALESLKLPKAPAEIAKQLAGKCKRSPTTSRGAARVK